MRGSEKLGGACFGRTHSLWPKGETRSTIESHMGRKRFLILGVLVLGTALFAFLWTRRPNEPMYKGKSISAWIEDIHQPGSKAASTEAQAALRGMGTNAVAWLLDQFARPLPKPSGSLDRITSELPWFGFGSRFRRALRRTQSAADGLHLMGSNAASAWPTLVTYFGDSYRGPPAAGAIGGGGETALPILLAATNSANTTVVLTAVNGLYALARGTESAIPSLIELFNHPDKMVRMGAVVGLSGVELRPDLTVTTWVVAASDPDPWLQSLAEYKLSLFDGNAQPAITNLLLLMTSSNATVAQTASNTVLRINPAALAPRRRE
jgi:hypothetical protein